MPTLHAVQGDDHLVATLMRVHLAQDGDSWFAQGLDVDYAACGANEEEAKRNFEVGFDATVGEHLKAFGSLEKLLTPAEKEAWKDFYACSGSERKVFFTVQRHDLTDVSDVLPFTGIAYLKHQHV